MLAFLDSLCSALIARNVDEIRRLLRHPLARALPRLVREEALAVANGGVRGFVAPLHTIRLYHQTAHLLGACADPASTTPPGSLSDPAPGQIELPLEAVGGALSFPPSFASLRTS